AASANHRPELFPTRAFPPLLVFAVATSASRRLALGRPRLVLMPEALCTLTPGPSLTGPPCVIQDIAYRSGGGSINRFRIQFAVSCHNSGMRVTILAVAPGTEYHPARTHRPDEGVGGGAAAAVVRCQQQIGTQHLPEHLILTTHAHIPGQQHRPVPDYDTQHTGLLVGRCRWWRTVEDLEAHPVPAPALPRHTGLGAETGILISRLPGEHPGHRHMADNEGRTAGMIVIGVTEQQQIQPAHPQGQQRRVYYCFSQSETAAKACTGIVEHGMLAGLQQH